MNEARRSADGEKRENPPGPIGPHPDRETLIRREMERLQRPVNKWLSGLAFSGGGIRSASFCLGVAQALEEKGKLEDFDYLSTVSGGGYTGSALTWLRSFDWDDPSRFFRRHSERHTPKEFDPAKVGDGLKPSHAAGSTFAKVLERFADFLRSRGNYLDPNKRLNALALVGVVLRTMVIHLAVYWGAAVLVFYGLRAWPGWSVKPYPAFQVMLWGSVCLLGTLALASLCYALSTSRRTGATFRYVSRTSFQVVFGQMLTVALLLAFIGSVPWVHDLIAEYLGEMFAKGTLAALGALLGGAQAVAQFMKAQAGRESGGWFSNEAGVWVSALAGVYGLLLLADEGGKALVGLSAPTGLPSLPADLPGSLYWAALVLVIVVVVGVITNINLVTPHRMYRDRLMEAFLPNPVDMLEKESAPAVLANDMPLTEMCQGVAPLHLINTNLVLVDSGNTLYRGRGGDNFVLSPVWCGGDATGWADAATFLGMDKNALTLPTAMAISGAAVNAHCGPSGQGAMRNALVSMLMTVFGLQLGYWMSRGGCHTKRPNFFLPGAYSLFGYGFSQKSSFLQLSDGGHFENLAIYELVRRRAKVIVAVDGGADPDYQFGDMGNAIERVYADFGVTIDFNEAGPYGPVCQLGALVPADGAGEAYPASLGLAKRGWVKGVVHYPGADDGVIYYLKSTLVDGLPASIYAYKATDLSFPHQTTGDQFFDEPQLEAYRRLGYELARSLADDL